ncbi:hypothetical protein ABOM_010575 [Aspergillus bombycis]|uniref:Late endosomal/lysosomal adaptor and MAPK and MTOR activator 5 n=1 Tax=Aspergillus bombycis TaxID=109264 RepID=A0A1F7ZML1_9EURO|nr:hypothetical protein ABOM_010575 [Aspergillus bombycis]OGM40672.1 hypothetical protein ABOM_010575 [Aspergillus bombycis]
MTLTHVSGALVLLLRLVATALATVTRYTVPIPAGTLILETRQQLHDMAAAYSMGTLDDRNGGYYLLDHDGEVLAVAADGLCAELDGSMRSASRVHEQRSRSDSSSGEFREVTLQSHDGPLPRLMATHVLILVVIRMRCVKLIVIASYALRIIIGVTNAGGGGIAVRFF